LGFFGLLSFLQSSFFIFCRYLLRLFGQDKLHKLAHRGELAFTQNLSNLILREQKHLLVSELQSRHQLL
jgi:hypothetical protein